MNITMYEAEKTAKRIIDEYKDMLYRICTVRLHNAADVEDAVQEVYFKYFKSNKSFPDKEKEKAWLIVVAINQCNDMIRKQIKNKHISLDSVMNELAAPSSENDMVVIIEELPDKYRVPLVLYHVEGYSTKEIARIMKLTLSTVKMRLQKGRKLLRTEIEKEGE